MLFPGSSLTEWTAWAHVPRIALIQAAVRRHLLVWGARERWVDAPLGVRAHVYEAGHDKDGPPVVLVHGLGDSAHTWFRTMPRIVAAGHRVIAVDLYGHGHTPLPDDRTHATVSEHVDLVDAVVRETLGDASFALVGHSLGGWVAARFAARGEHDIGRLVLVESAGLPYDGIERDLALLRVRGEQDVRRLWETACHRVPWELRLFQKDVARLFDLPVIREFVDADHTADAITEDVARAITVPTTLIWGKEDGLVPPHLGERLACLIPNAEIHWIPDCGHAPQLEAPKQFHAHLTSALARAPWRSA